MVDAPNDRDCDEYVRFRGFWNAQMAANLGSQVQIPGVDGKKERVRVRTIESITPACDEKIFWAYSFEMYSALICVK